jgi:hypothetical protein
MFNLNDKSKSNVISSDMTCVHYVATSGYKLYYTNYKTHAVTCCDLHGTTQWEFKNERVLKAPLLVDLSLRLNIFMPSLPAQQYIVLPLTAMPQMFVSIEIVVMTF